MSYRKGVIVSIRQCAGCIEVTVAGESPGAFVVDNCCFPGIADCEGADWIGRPIEYEDGYLRFLDSSDACKTGDSPRPKPASLPLS